MKICHSSSSLSHSPNPANLRIGNQHQTSHSIYGKITTQAVQNTIIHRRIATGAKYIGHSFKTTHNDKNATVKKCRKRTKGRCINPPSKPIGSPAIPIWKYRKHPLWRARRFSSIFVSFVVGRMEIKDLPSAAKRE